MLHSSPFEVVGFRFPAYRVPKARSQYPYYELNLTWFKWLLAAKLPHMQKREVRPGRPKGATTFESAPAIAFGSTVRERRLERGVSQEELASLAQVERSHMGKIERGEHLPNLVMILRIAQALNCKPGKLVDHVAEILRVD